MVIAASTLLLAGCVTVVVDDRRADVVTPHPDDLDNRTELSCSPGEELLLNAPSTLYTISGPCESVTVEGNDLIVRAELIERLVLRGDRLLVEASAIESLQINGQDNTVRADTIDDVTVNGDRNTLASYAPIGDADDRPD